MQVPCYIIRNYDKDDSQEPPTDVRGEVVSFFTADSSHELEEDEEVSSLALEVDPYARIRSKLKTFSTFRRNRLRRHNRRSVGSRTRRINGAVDSVGN